MKALNSVWLAVFVCIFAVSTKAEQIYVSRGGTQVDIGRMNLDGSSFQSLLSTSPAEVHGIAFDRIHGKMYFTEGSNGLSNNKVRRANFDGSNPEDLVLLGTTVPNSIAIDGDKVYWTEGQTAALRRANLDGSNPQTIASGSFDGMAVATCLQKIYWIAGGPSNTLIQRANMDGSGVETVVSLPGESPSPGFAISSAGKIYWNALSSGNRVLRSANLDGSGVNILTTISGGVIWSIDVDEDAGKIYWSLIGATGKIRRANLDGTSVEDVVTAPANIFFIAMTFDFGSPGLCPAVSTWGLTCLFLLIASAATMVMRKTQMGRAAL